MQKGYLGTLGRISYLHFCFSQQQLRKLVLEIIHRIPTNEHLRPHTKNVLSVMFRFLEVTFENFYYLATFKTFNDFLTVKSCITQLFPFH